MKSEKCDEPGPEVDHARDIEARTFQFALRIVKLCVLLGGCPGAHRTIGNQLIRAGTSVGANVTEAQAAQSKPDFISKMNIALKESREAHYWLRLLGGSELIDPERLRPITQEAEEITRILGAIVRTARRNLNAQ